MKLKNLVSIIMTCHNGQRFLNEAVDSLIKQTHENWELIFYNNYSSDRSKNIILKYNDKRIRYFETDKILSLGDIRNTLHENSLESTYMSQINPGATYGAGQPSSTWPSLSPTGLDLNGNTPTQYIDNMPE